MQTESNNWIQIEPIDDAFSHFLGIYIKAHGTGTCTVGLNIQPHLINSFGAVHGGVIATLVDMAGGVASYSAGTPSTTLSCDIHYLKGAFNAVWLEASAEPRHLGNNTRVFDVRVSDQDGAAIASATVTYYVLDADRYVRDGQTASSTGNQPD